MRAWKVFLGIFIGAHVVYQINLYSSKQAVKDLPGLTVYSVKDSWTIKKWISADKEPESCSAAHELMDQGAYSVTTYGRGSPKTRTVIDNLSGCKSAGYWWHENLNANLQIWCSRRSDHYRYEVLCTEWETYGKSYQQFFDSRYEAAKSRLVRETGSAYLSEIRAMESSHP